MNAYVKNNVQSLNKCSVIADMFFGASLLETERAMINYITKQK